MLPHESQGFIPVSRNTLDQEMLQVVSWLEDQQTIFKARDWEEY